MPTAAYRYCFDSIAAADIPAGVEIVAGYVDGIWADWEWAMFPDSIKVRIAVFASTDDGHVLDVENGDATPDQAPGWVVMRRAAGMDPTVYTSLGEWPAVRAAFRAAGVTEPHYWIAHYDNDPTPIAGAVAKQYANPPLTHGHYDLSVVPGVWPGVEDADMFTDADRAMLKKVYDHLEAYEPMTWVSRLQVWLAKAIRSIFANADLTGPDVKSGDPFK